MRYLKKLAPVGLVVVLMLSLVACGGTKSVTGTWGLQGNESETVYVFNDDGTGVYSLGDGISVKFTYTTDNGKLSISKKVLSQTETEEFTYKIKGKQLTLTNSDGTNTFNKQ
jgi:uncharacterized lipoprotein YehR (DUF1307 family)